MFKHRCNSNQTNAKQPNLHKALMALTSPSSAHIYFILDESGSMSHYTGHTRECVRTIIEGNLDPQIHHTVIVFSDKTAHATNVLQLSPPQHNGTQILPAFQLMHTLVQQKPLPEQIIVVFVSDGMDSAGEPDKLEKNLRNLGKLPIHSLLFTVGVGKDFPTGLVVDVLRPLYHHGNASTQSVLPVTSPDDLTWAFGQLEALMLEELAGTNVVPTSIDESTNTKEIMLFVQARYNECVIKCAATRRTPMENYTLLFNTKTMISEASRIAKLRLSMEQSDETVRQFKPLVSNILREKVYSSKACLTAALSAVTRLNGMIQDACKGKIMSELSDEAKKELLGGQYVTGKLFTVANKYRAADFGRTKNSLLRLLRNYVSNPQDMALVDSINFGTQAEYFEDARENLQALIPLTHTLPGILKMLSIVCRTVTFEEPIPHDALQMNEWLAEVVALPQLIPNMTTYDFFERHNCSFTSRGEHINGLWVRGGDKNSPGFYHHVQSLLLLKHPGLSITTARLAVSASVLFFLLGSHETIRPWMQTELKIIDEICAGYTRQFLEAWHVYVETVTNPDFRMCLVTESPKLPPHCKCPGLTKFILALYVAATGGLGTDAYRFSIEELKERHHAMVVEFIARTRIAVTTCLRFDTQGESDTLLKKVWSNPVEDEDRDGGTIGEDILTASVTLQEAKTRFSTLIDLGLSVESMIAPITASAKMSMKALKAARYYQFTIARINTTFKNLASICGHGDEMSFALSKAELFGALQTANRLPNSYDRFRKSEPPKTPTEEEMTELAIRLAKDQLRKTIMSQVDSWTEQHYITRHEKLHSTTARIIPTQHMERFKQKFGYDIAKDWAVNSSGLSNIACCAPGCNFYLKPLTTRLYAHHDTICTELHQHLRMGTSTQPLPAFHKTVARFHEMMSDRIATLVESGECLADPMASSMCLTGLKYAQDNSALQYWQNRQTISINEKKAKLHASIKYRCDEMIRKDGWDALETEIVNLQDEFTAPTWPYDDFERVFLAKYKKHPERHDGKTNFTLQ